MYKLIRVGLIVSVLLMAYLLAFAIFVVPYLWVVAGGVLIGMLCMKTYSYTAYGTARWAQLEEIPHLLEGNGMIVGRIEGRYSLRSGVKGLFDSRIPAWQACQKFLISRQRKQPKQLVRLTTAVHTIVVAPTSAGKGVSCIVPFMFTCPDSMVSTDFKGENTTLTADVRRKMGHRVVVLDPFKVTTPEPDTFNPLEWIDKDSPTALDDCRDLAEALVVRSGQEKEPHWCDSAEVWITAMIATVVCFAEGSNKNLQSVRALLTNPEKMQMAIRMMCESEDIWDGMLSRLGFQLTHFKDKELSSTLTTTNRFMRFLDTIAIADSTQKSTFDPADLLTGKMTVFLILPPEHMRAQSALLRLWISSMLRAVVKGGLQEKTKVHFILDEAASLGHMDALDDAVDKYRGYGVRLQFYYQSLGQLKKCWQEGGDQTLLSNTTQVFFRVNDHETAEYVSARLGEQTIVVKSGGKSSGRSWQRSKQETTYSGSSNSNDNWNQIGRKLLRPEEVTGLSERIAIILTPGVKPIWTRLVRYYEKDFKVSRGVGLIKAMFVSTCLFLCSTLLAVSVTAALFIPIHR
jgi:type IV secretion system protein VirD4